MPLQDAIYDHPYPEDAPTPFQDGLTEEEKQLAQAQAQQALEIARLEQEKQLAQAQARKAFEAEQLAQATQPTFSQGLAPGFAAPIAYPYQDSQPPSPPPPVDPNRRYIDQQLRLADLIRERGVREADPALIAQRVAAAGMAPLQPGETMPQGLREQNPDEIALRQDIANQQQAGTFGPPRQPPMPRFYNPTTQSSRTGNNGANGIVNFNNSLLNRRGSNPYEVYKLKQQMLAQDAYIKKFSETGDRNLALQAAEQFLVGTPAGTALSRGLQPPPGPPQGFTLPGGAQGAFVPGTTRFGFIPKNTLGTPESAATKTALQKNAESILEADAEAKAAVARGDMEGANIALKRGALIERQLKNQVDDALKQEVKWNNAEITGWLLEIQTLKGNRNWEKRSGIQVTNLLEKIKLKKNEIRSQLNTPSDTSTPTASKKILYDASGNRVKRRHANHS